MAYFLLGLLILVAVAMIGCGLRQRNGLLLYPTLAGAAWLGYVVPQAIGLMANPGRLPAGVLEDWGMELTLLMCVLCAGMSFLGYLKPAAALLRPRRRVRTIAHYSDTRLFQAGLLLALVGGFGFYRLTRLSGGFLEYFSVEGHYALEWRGLPVMYVWFGGMAFPGLVLCLVATLHRPSRARWAGVALAGLYPMITVVLLGRRGNFFHLALIIALSLYFVRCKAPPRWLLLPALGVGFLIVQLAPAYRTHFRIGADVSQLGELEPLESVRSVFEGKKGVTEMNYAVVQIAAAHRAGRFNYGVGLYNRIISRWVPRLIFGDAFKEALFLPTAPHRAAMLRYYGYRWSYGSFPTGYMDAFRELWFLGALLFYVIGAGFRVLWEAAQRGSFASQVFLIWLSYYSLTSVLQGVTGLPSTLLLAAFYFVPAMLWAGPASRRAELPVGGNASRGAAKRSAGFKRREGN